MRCQGQDLKIFELMLGQEWDEGSERERETETGRERLAEELESSDDPVELGTFGSQGRRPLWLKKSEQQR